MPELVYWRAVELKFITHLRTMCQTLCYFISFPPYNNPTEKVFTPFFFFLQNRDNMNMNNNNEKLLKSNKKSSKTFLNQIFLSF